MKSITNFALGFLSAFALLQMKEQYQKRHDTEAATNLSVRLLQLQKINQETRRTIEVLERDLLGKSKNDEGKYFFHELSEYFNVKPISGMIYQNDEVKQMVETHNVVNDSSYRNFFTSVEKDSELYNGFLDREKAGIKSMYVKWNSKEIGYGCFANVDLPPDTYLGEYAGILTKDNANTDYMWSYLFENPEGDAELGIDGRHTGNLLRFVNHSEKLKNVRLTYQVKDGVWRLGYVTTAFVKKDQELFTSYGASYWEGRTLVDPETLEVEAGSTKETQKVPESQ
jgi:hypothetical protein